MRPNVSWAVLAQLTELLFLTALSTVASQKDSVRKPGVMEELQEKSSARRNPKPAFEMKLLHLNDMHSRFEQTNRLSGVCTPWEAEHHICVGGFARVATVIKQAREAEKRGEGPPVLVLNAGDNFQGSIYYSLFKAEIVAKFINMLDFDALTLGNHEFDDGLKELVPYLKNITKPIVSANIDFSKISQLSGVQIRRSTVVDVGGQKVGIIGYTTRETVTTDDVEITEEIPAVQEEARRLTKKGIKIIIALGHSGYSVDKQVALEVPEIDLVVGAHSHTFLFNTSHPPPDSSDIPTGTYPTIVTQSSGRKVPVVQAYAFTKYIGRLFITFDETGEIMFTKGNPLLLDKNIPEDPDVLVELDSWKHSLTFFTNKVEGSTSVVLESTDCRQRECNIGNAVADAMVYSRVKEMPRKNFKGWTDAPIAFVNSGNIRNSIDARTQNDAVTLRDIIEVIPYKDYIDIVKLNGKDLIEVLEHSVSQYDPTGADMKGGFLQVSGLQVTYNIDKPPGQRVEKVLARCGECDVPKYYPVKNDETYSILTNKFLLEGGDGYSMIPAKGEITHLGNNELDVLKRYFSEMSPINAEVGFRIIIKTNK